ncbi:hypothetical protein C3V05_005394, partial [Escherichia coli]|nr:hypothetical protein [Escherichia coli]
HICSIIAIRYNYHRKAVDGVRLGQLEPDCMKPASGFSALIPVHLPYIGMSERRKHHGDFVRL